MNPFPVIVADIRQNKIGISLVVLLIALAVGLGIAISAQERALRLGSNRAADPFDLLLGAPGSKTQLLMSTVYLQAAPIPLIDGRILCELQNNKHVQYAAPIGFGDSYKGYPVVGTVAAMADLAGQRPLSAGKLFSRVNEAVIGIDVNLKRGDTFFPVHGQVEENAAENDEHHEHTAIKYKVVGRMQRWGSPWDKAILVPIEAVWFIHGLGSGHRTVDAEPTAAQQIQAVGSPDNSRQHADHSTPPRLASIPVGPPWDPTVIPGVPAIALGIDKAATAYRLRSLYNKKQQTMAFFPAEVLLQMYALLGDAGTVLSLLALTTQVLVLGSVLLAVFASLVQKRKQFGVLRALGASGLYVFTVIWGYVVLLVSSGAVLGILIGRFSAWILSIYVGRETGLILPVAVTGKEILMALTLIGLSFLIAIIPAVAVYRDRVSSLLRL